MNNSKKIKLFVFWLGDKSHFSSSKYDEKIFDVIVGPSQEDHEILMKKYPYYKHGFENKRYSFCSDVWRLYVLSANVGLYIDASVILGPEVASFIKDIKDKDVVAFRGNFKYVESGVLWSGVKNNQFYNDVLKRYESDLNISSFVMPVFLSVAFWKQGFAYGWNAEEKNQKLLLPLTKIRDRKTIWKTSIGSWGKSKQNFNYSKTVETTDWWKPWEEKFSNQIIDEDWSVRVERALAGATIDITMIRMFYDLGFPRKQLNNDYKKIDYKIKIRERLIWSKLFVFFTFKWFSKF